MGFSCGIVGLPNVGKSTLFNALTKRQTAEAANYPFCTIDPNEGDVVVPDLRLERLSKIVQSEKTIPTRLFFTDIAGLVEGASSGEGLGNRFLGHIREANALLHVLRGFEDEGITHVRGVVDPLRDAEIVETELMLADMASLTRRVEAQRKKARGGLKDSLKDLSFMESVLAELEKGNPSWAEGFLQDKEQKARLDALQLLTARPLLFVCNTDEEGLRQENAHTAAIRKMAERQKRPLLIISARLEEELWQFSPKERTDFLKEMGAQASGLEKLITSGYDLLGLITYFTAGEKEARAWTIQKGALAPQAAGRIHGDFEKNFIRAEVVSYEAFVRHGGWAGARDAGAMRLEGRDYLVQDGDVMHIRHSA